jgi:aldehyde dehydrogenase (NAD+)
VSGGTFESLSPATGEVVATFADRTVDEVAAAVAAAREASGWWDELGFTGRRDRLLAWRTWLAKHIRELAELIHTENGKPTDDALFEIGVAIEHLDWAAKKAEKVLRSRRTWPGVLAANHATSIDYVPFGVVGVIGPWNYPVHTPLGSISYALAAGNAVVFKPSEYTPAVGQWLADSFAPVVDDRPVFTVVTGRGATGAALCRSGVDKLAFTGSTRTGRQVMVACSETLTPVVIECGGKDVLVVAEDADLDRAAEAAVWGGMTNGGQTCVGVERVIAVGAIYDDLVAGIAARAARLRAGDHRSASYGPITMPGQVDVIERHINDALDRGAQAVVGGRTSVHRPYVDPVVLTDVPADAEVEQEETFGPVITVARADGIDDAIKQANASCFGLGAAVYSASRGSEIAARLRAGMVSINSVITFAAVPSIPFGGVGDSGFGRIHGPDGLREFARSRAITRTRFPGPINLQTFDRKPAAVKNFVTLIQSVWGR